MTDKSDDELSLDQIALAIVNIRKEKASILKKAEKQAQELESQKEELENYARSVMAKLGTSSVKTKSGTIISQDVVKYSTNDWNDYYRVIAENDRFDLLEKRVSQKNLQQFLEENPEKEPKGLHQGKRNQDSISLCMTNHSHPMQAIYRPKQISVVSCSQWFVCFCKE